MDFNGLGQSLLTTALVVVALKTDIDWLKSIVKEHAKRINKLETAKHEII